MRDYITKTQNENHIVLKEAMNRNIIFVGKTRSGKSTALSVLKNPFTFVQLGSIFSETIDASINHFTVEVEGANKTKTNFNISIIDTPGLFEVVNIGTARDEEALEELILKCMNAEITKIHRIFFVVSYAGAINVQDIEALERFVKLFNGAERFVNVLITKCESFSEEEKGRIEEELRQYPKFSNLLSTVGQTIFFSGAVEQRLFEAGYEDVFNKNLDNVMYMREDLFNVVFREKEYFELNSLRMVDKVRIEADKLFQEIKTEFETKACQKNPEAFKAKCKKLGTWLPFLSSKAYDEANELLKNGEKWLREQGLVT